VNVVTGGAGFIGSHLVESLVDAGEEVRVFDNFSTGRMENLVPGAVVIDADIRDRKALESALEGADYVFHHAAQVSAPGSVEDPLTNDEINVRGTLNVLLAANEVGVKRVVLASSCAVYGDTDRLPISEDTPTLPLSPYAASKLAGEVYAGMFHRLYGLETVCLRYFNVFGPRQDPKSQYAAAIPIFITALLEGRRPTIYGDGEQTRDFVYVGDVVRANLLARDSPSAVGGVFNVSGGKRISVNELIGMLGHIAGKDPNPVHASERPGDVRHSGGDGALARRVLGFAPQVPFEEGLRRTFEWFAAQMLGS